MIYDITDVETFHNIKNWLEEVNNYAPENASKMLIGNKCDLENKRAVERKAGEELAASLNMTFIEASAKSAVNVENAFMQLAQSLIDS